MRAMICNDQPDTIMKRSKKKLHRKGQPLSTMQKEPITIKRKAVLPDGGVLRVKSLMVQIYYEKKADP